ncbi:MAG: DISARM system SNF2-like helicase DrmD [Acidobacteriota bacterium]
MTAPAPRSILEVLTRARLAAVGRELGVPIPASAVKEAQIEAMASSPGLALAELLRFLGRDELRAACRAHGLDDSGRSRPALLARLLEAAGETSTPAAASVPVRHVRPHPGDVVQVRHRQYLVEETSEPSGPGEATRVVLAGLDDDNQGRRLEVLWEIELGARILQPELHAPDTRGQLDPPRAFAAYLNALRWNAVTATDARLFQAPFRAGIKIIEHQLTPLKRALDLPRANLFIADDVGLGKTVEAGLVLQELILRQQVDFTLVVCPAALCLQWRDEMERRFGLRFEIYNRAFVARRRQERGFAVNPWTTHNRFVVSYQLLRRPEYRDPLLQALGDRARKSLLVLDEAHTAAPATASVYAVDSRITHVIRDVAPRFEHRLFLSATPHNGHSNSFSALLEILDPNRFTRGVKVERGQLDKVMVRRLKSDLRELGIEGYPVRRLVQLDLTHEAGSWSCRASAPGGDFAAQRLDLGQVEPVELRLSALLAEYTALVKPRRNKRGQLVFINLQKRLLSSVEAFYRTLRLHADNAGADPGDDAQLSFPVPEDDEYGQDDEASEASTGAEIAAASRRLVRPEGRARQILDEMLGLAERWRHMPDAKTLALLGWIRQHQCHGAIPGRTGRDLGRAAFTAWTGRRVIVFTEYGDTQRYLHRMLAGAIEGTDDAERRLLRFHGGMSDDARDEVQRAFNAPPDEHPVRILLATDAAREGVNLQGHCADLFHFDIPWNPARLEQRNGRIDRTLQREPEVRCHYFSYTQREEDRVLDVVVAKVQTIQRELGSLSAVLLERWAEILDLGIGAGSRVALEEADQLEGRRETVREELESERADRQKLAREIDDAGRILQRSKDALEFEPELLREAVDAALVLDKAGPLKPWAGENAYVLPGLPETWQATLDTLRPPRRRDEAFWDWRHRPPLPVVFKPLDRLDGSRVHLHLQHPFVQRLLSRFLAQGYGAHDLSRVTAVRDPYGAQVVVLVFGRLSLFGAGAARLHDQLVAVAAPWFEAGGPDHLQPFEGAAEEKALERLNRILRELPPDGDPHGGVSERVRDRLRASARADFATLWPHVEAEADALVHEAERKLAERGAAESDALKGILRNQRLAIQKALAKLPQLTLAFAPTEPKAQQQVRQIEQDRDHMEGRLLAIDREIESEPAAIQDLYKVVLTRREPVGMVYLWPEARG